MNLESQGRRKKLGIKRFINSFKYSFDGLAYAIKNEQSILIMVIFLITVILGGWFFNITLLEWFIILFAIGLVLGTELLNTSIEATIDLISPKIHPLAKIAKDTASASVFVYSTIAFIIGCLIFVPKIIEWIGRIQ
ncbi:MAG TPA: diacylglycerol kinase family protein [Mollicutes bacterium]|nr:diacylglycerol kinase family protein [Mollicutes bacterium]